MVVAVALVVEAVEVVAVALSEAVVDVVGVEVVRAVRMRMVEVKKEKVAKDSNNGSNDGSYSNSDRDTA